MNTYVNKAKHKGPKEKKDLRANCGKNTNKNNLLHGKICTFTSLCSNEKKHPIQKNFRHIVLFLKIVYPRNAFDCRTLIQKSSILTVSCLPPKAQRLIV